MTVSPLSFNELFGWMLMLVDLTDKEIIKLCEICSDIGVAFVKTSTGYGFVKGASGDYNYKGATIPHL
jgi:deoxyribose-phosphate aldolase